MESRTGRTEPPLSATKRLGIDGRIVIYEEALEDYARGSNGVRLTSDARFVTWLGHQLSAFDSNHDSPLRTEPAAVAWPLGTIDLNGWVRYTQGGATAAFSR
jgi:hypothetical protein